MRSNTAVRSSSAPSACRTSSRLRDSCRRGSSRRGIRAAAWAPGKLWTAKKLSLAAWFCRHRTTSRAIGARARQTLTPMSSCLCHRPHARARSTRLALLACLLVSRPGTAAEKPNFEKEILPLLYARCFACHSEKKAKPKGDLKLDSVAAIREGAVITAGAPDESELFKRIAL